MNTTSRLVRTMRLTASLLPLGLLGACNLAPHYRPPTTTPLTAEFRAAPGWQAAQPGDDVAKGQWWKLFGDPVLDGLEARVLVTNQNLAYYRAAYAEAVAAVKVDRAAQFPSIGVNASVTRSGNLSSQSKAATTIVAGPSASWVPDLWGKLANTTRAARATAEASAATLANATLSAQATLAQDYFQVRMLDAQIALLDTTIDGYRKSLAVSEAQYKAGTVSAADVASAQSTLASALASRRDLDRQRVASEAAVAVLVGDNPSSFTIVPVAWAPVVPAIPEAVPSQVLERRPDIASAERLVAAANADIGVARGAFFPSLTLSGALQSTVGALGNLFSAAGTLWSLGASTSETVIDFGGRSGTLSAARAAYDQTVATYRQTVLNAFQEVETELAAVSGYNAEAENYRAAADAATRAEAITRNEYKAGTVDYTTVATAQASAYTARVALLTNTLNRQNAAVSLIEAIGGEWAGKVDLDPPVE